jgi:hypothetical protein
MFFSETPQKNKKINPSPKSSKPPESSIFTLSAVTFLHNQSHIFSVPTVFPGVSFNIDGMDNVADSVVDAHILFCGLEIVRKVTVGILIHPLSHLFSRMVSSHHGLRIHLDVMDLITMWQMI